MINRPLLSYDNPQLTTEHKNPVARLPEFKHILDSCFGHTILPAKQFKSFNQTDAQLYISDRRWQVDYGFQPENPSVKHEEYLDDLFWDTKNTRTLAFLLGGVGTGKSTFLDFYLRCYCPTLSQHQYLFHSKLVVYIDAKGINDEHNLHTRIYTQAAQCILRCLKEAHFQIRLDSTADPYRDPNAWTLAVLRHIAEARKQEQQRPGMPAIDPIPFRYIVLVLDNLDQSTLGVQKRAMSIVHEWLRDCLELGIWRIYVPMWPSTHEKLMEAMGYPFSKDTYSDITLGYIPYHRVIMTRKNEVVQRMLVSNLSVPCDDDADQQELVVKDGRVENERCRAFITDIHMVAERHIGELIERLCHNDLRRQLTIWENLMSGRIMWTSWIKHLAAQAWNYSSHRVPYPLIDAALTGPRRYYNSSMSRIANVFDCTRGSGTDGTLVLGIQLLQLLASAGESLAEHVVYRVLERCLGYSEEDVACGLRHLFEANVFHEMAGDGGTNMLIIHTGAVDVYLNELARHPAYLDNVALVTPVSPEALKGMCITTSGERDEFKKRVYTTLAFISFFRQEETAVIRRTVRRLLAMEADVRAKEIQFLGKFVFQCAWKQAALRYRERLHTLKTYGYFRDLVVNWDSILDSNRLLEDAVGVPDKWDFTRLVTNAGQELRTI